MENTNVPEIQQYVKQQRSAGVSDAQIRQNLAMQGWAEADLAGVFEGTPISTDTTPISHKRLWITLFTVLGLVILGYVAYSFYLSPSCCAKPTIIPIPTQSLTPSSTNSTNTSSGAKLCGNWPNGSQDEGYLTGAKYLSKITSSTSVNGMTIYPNATKIIEINTGTDLHQLIACAKSASISDIVNYYQRTAGIQVFDGSVGGPNVNFGSLKATKIVQNAKGILIIYDAGQGDVLLAYSYR